MLGKLSFLLTEIEKKKRQLCKFFKDSFVAKSIITQRFLLQKINYIYNNPVSSKWMLAKDPTAIRFVKYGHITAHASFAFGAMIFFIPGFAAISWILWHPPRHYQF